MKPKHRRKIALHDFLLVTRYWSVVTVFSVSLCLCGVFADAAEKFWGDPRSSGPYDGTFSDPTKWSSGVAGPADIAHFGITNSNFFQASYTVSFSANATNLNFR